MKQPNLARLALSLLAAGMGVLLFFAFSKHNAKYAHIRQLPKLKALAIYGDTLDISEYLDSTKRTALFFFHPECEYCRKELEGVLTRHPECRNVQWVFITTAPAEEVEEFLMEYPIQTIPDAHVLREGWPDIHRKFGVKGPPALFIYNENGHLMKRHMGAISIKTIVQDLQ